jgi:hypothetical protein
MPEQSSPSPVADSPETHLTGTGPFAVELKKAPAMTSLGLVAEYGMFASAIFLAGSLYATRVPMRAVDRVLGLRLRERFIDLIARASPG